jgi:4-diphosphocytidyl-2-C-methyl-D-erythritol kinase
MEGSNPVIKTLKAHAKINLALSVTGRRPDGYHELSMINARLALSDEVSFTLKSLQTPPHNDKNSRGKIDFNLTTAINAAYITSDSLPITSDNIIAKTVNRFNSVFSEVIENSVQLDITLKKNIPVGGGLGGGSSDAALVLRFLYQNLIASNDSLDTTSLDPILANLALTIGADVPFFLHNIPLAHVSGIGEKIITTTVQDVEVESPICLLVPKFSISTKKVFETLRQQKDHTFSVAKSELFQNDLVHAASIVEPRIESLINSLSKISNRSGLSGSGSTLYCLAPSQDQQNKLITFAKNENLTIIETNIA